MGYEKMRKMRRTLEDLLLLWVIEKSEGSPARDDKLVLIVVKDLILSNRISIYHFAYPRRSNSHKENTLEGRVYKVDMYVILESWNLFSIANAIDIYFSIKNFQPTHY